MYHRKWLKYIGLSAGCLALLAVCTGIVKSGDQPRKNTGSYSDLTADPSDQEPLSHLSDECYADGQFTSHLPLVVIDVPEEPPVYKTFEFDGTEIVYENVDPWVQGAVHLIDSGHGNNCITDEPVYTGNIKLKIKGHSSIRYAKKQYLFKLTDEQGQYVDEDLLGMGAGNSWILNGSLADKSMMRNYLCYRVSSEIGGNNMAMDSRYCEVLFKTEEGYKYQGLYLLIEAIDRGKSRVDIESAKKENIYTSYIVRRDRYTNYDPMLETYGRLNGLSKEWIGVKYPGKTKMTPAMLQYIQEDFSHIERIIYSDDPYTFMSYSHLVDTKSFIDYFIINEFFGNYDAGEHSNYMYKNTGGQLCMGPVWDFDQALNNSILHEADSQYTALNDKAFYERLTKDRNFLESIKVRYGELSESSLSLDHIFDLMGQIQAHIRSARQRDWFRWKENYEDKGHRIPGSYVIADYEKDGIALSRFNTNYDQELYVMRTYLRQHSKTLQQQLTALKEGAVTDSSYGGQKEIMLAIACIIFLVPAYIINRRE